MKHAVHKHSAHKRAAHKPIDLPIYDGTLITLELSDSGDFLYLRTISREFKSPLFLLSVERFRFWENHQPASSLYDKDIRNFLDVRRRKDEYYIRAFWLDVMGSDVHGHTEDFCIPHDIMQRALNGEKTRHLHYEKVAMPHVDTSHVSGTLRTIAADKQMRRALSKTLRYAFRCAKQVTLYPDFVPHSFSFKEDNIHGGLILSKENQPRHPGQPCALCYSIHT